MCLVTCGLDKVFERGGGRATHLATAITPDIRVKRTLFSPVRKRRARGFGGWLGAAWEVRDDGSGAASAETFVDIEFVHESVAICAFEICEEGVQEGLHLTFALVDAAARRLLGSGSSSAFGGLSWDGKDGLELAVEKDLASGAVRAVVCDCGGPVAIVLGDVANDDARRRAEVDHPVATINAPEIVDELFADTSVSERRGDGDGAKYARCYGGRGKGGTPGRTDAWSGPRTLL
jgi:hypothetical protein